MTLATNHQKKVIHTIAGKIGMDDEARRALMQQSFGVRSSKDLTVEQARKLIDVLYSQAVTATKKGKPGRRWDHLGNRPGMASPAQLRMLEVLWSKFSRYDDHESRDKAFCSWLSKRFKVSHPTMIPGRLVGQIKLALDSMVEQAESKEAA